ncbi:MAG: Xaa-Pro peptidase family protein [candidate division WOR-3 bacterium]
MSPEEKERRHKLITDFMEREGIDCILIYGREGFNTRGNMRYVTGYGVHFGEQFCIFPYDDEPVFFGSSSANYHVKKKGWVKKCVELVDPQKQIVEHIKDFYRGNSIGVPNLMNLPAYMYLALDKHFPIKDVTMLFRKARSIKSTEEMEKIRIAAYIADKACEAVREILKPGISDFEIYAKVKETIYRMGCEYSMDFIDAEGNRVNLFNPTGNLARTGKTVVVEISPSFDGYYAQLAVTFPVEECTDELRSLFRVWKKAVEAGEELLRSGVKVCEVYEKVVRTIEDSGYLSPLRPGHAIGLDVIDFFSISKEEETELASGMVLAFHPCVMKETGEGIGMGCTYVIKEKGFERLSKLDLKSLVEEFSR